MACVAGDPRRSLTLMVERDIRAEFKARINSAIKGRLKPEEECKPLRSDPELYEIRWSDLSIPRKDLASGLYLDPDHAHFRLYYGERADRDWFIGVHVHEKVIVPNDPRATDEGQQEEIDEAVRIFQAPGDWGIPELNP